MIVVVGIEKRCCQSGQQNKKKEDLNLHDRVVCLVPNGEQHCCSISYARLRSIRSICCNPPACVGDCGH